MKVRFKNINEKQEFKRPDNIIKDNMNVLAHLKELINKYNRNDRYKEKESDEIEEYLYELNPKDIEVNDIDLDNIGLYIPTGAYVYAYGFRKMPNYGVIKLFKAGLRVIRYDLVKYTIETKEVLVPEKI